MNCVGPSPTPPPAGSSAPPSTTSSECPAAPAAWTVVSDLRGYNAHDAIVTGSCTLLVVAERLTDGVGVALRSRDGGRTLAPIPLSDAKRVRRVVSFDQSLVALGEDAQGHPNLYRSRDEGSSWVTTSVPLDEATQLATAGTALVLAGRTSANTVVIIGDGTTWSTRLTLPRSASIDALSARGNTVALGGANQGPLMYTSEDGGSRFGAVSLGSSYDGITAVGVQGNTLVIGGYHGRPIENAVAVSHRLDLSTGVLGALAAPTAVQFLGLACAEQCIAVTPTGHGDSLVRLAVASDRWEAMSSAAGNLVGLETVAIASGSAYAMGTGNPLLRGRP